MRFLGKYLGAALVAAAAAPDRVYAVCDNTAPASDATVTCTGADTTGVTALPGSTNVTVNIQQGATVQVTPGNAVTIRDASRVSNNGAVTGTGATPPHNAGINALGSGNTLTNAATGTVTTTGTARHAMAATGANNTLVNDGAIRTTSSDANAMVVSPTGAAESNDNVLTNNGTITTDSGNGDGLTVQRGNRNRLTNTGTINTAGGQASGFFVNGGSNILLNTGAVTTSGDASAAVFMQGDTNTFTNGGSIRTRGANAEAVFANTVSGTFRSTITNQAGGSIVSDQFFAIRGLNGQETLDNAGIIRSETGTAIVMGSATDTIINSGSIFGGNGTALRLDAGNDALTLQTGSSITGIADGGTGTDTLTLQGTGQATNDFVAFETLTIQGADWTLAGTGTFTSTQVARGTLRISGSLTSPVTVQNGATLQVGAAGTTGVLSGNVTNNGALVFDRSDSTTYGGVIASTGSLTQSGTGVLNLTGIGSTSADTFVPRGTLRVDAGASFASINTVIAAGATLDAVGTFGGTAGDDTADIAGVYNGIFDLGAGSDTVTIRNTASGSAAIAQGADADLFDMSGGTIASLSQGAGDDSASVSGGTITDNVDLGDGNDSFALSGGQIVQGFSGGAGADRLTWSSGGIDGVIALGDGNDTLVVDRVLSTLIAAPTQINGDAGSDTLTFDNVAVAGVSRLQGWESVEVVNGSQMTLDGNLSLGDSATGTGAITIDATSTLFAGNGANAVIAAFAGGSLASVVNRGTIDLTHGASGATDTLTIVGNYSAASSLRLDTILGSDNSPSDRLIISAGTASGRTALGIVNAGGLGAATTGDGIPVVLATAGGTTAADAFGLDRAVAAGPFEYLLFRGGSASGTQDNWYLRTHIEPELPPPAPPVEPQSPPASPPAPPTPVPAPAPAPTAIILPPTAVPEISAARIAAAEPIPLYRQEVAVYGSVPPITREAVNAALGTLHTRRGDHKQFGGDGAFSGAWGRALGQDINKRWQGDAEPDYDGTLAGVQAGLDFFNRESASGSHDHAGVFFGYSRIHGDVDGFAVGRLARCGEAELDTYSAGLYWTHVGAKPWYTDIVVMGSSFDGEATSLRGLAIDTDGDGLAASIEGGYPIALSGLLTLEPQAQVIWQRQSLDDAGDAFSSVDFEGSDAFIGRIGARLIGNGAGTVAVQPYLSANVWHTFAGNDSISFDGTSIVTRREGTALEIGAGLSATTGQTLGMYASLSYVTDLDSTKQNTLQANLGIRIAW